MKKNMKYRQCAVNWVSQAEATRQRPFGFYVWLPLLHQEHGPFLGEKEAFDCIDNFWEMAGDDVGNDALADAV